MCIITHTCSCGFPAKLPPCVVRYPRALRKKLEPTFGARGFWNQFLLDQKPRKPLPARVPMASAGTAQAREGLVAQNEWGRFMVRMSRPQLLDFWFASQDLSPFQFSPGCTAPVGCNGNTCLGDADLPLSRPTRFHSSFILRWVVFFLTEYFSGKALLCVNNY